MTKPVHIAIAIATYRRPAGLRRLLDSLDQLTFDRVARPRLTIIVVDNDAKSDVTQADLVTLQPLIYQVEPMKGLANVRNACLDKAPVDADFLAFIDDDEWAEPDWLDQLLRVQSKTGADIVQGVVRPVYETAAPAWMIEGRYHEVGPFKDCAPLTHGASGNILIRRAIIANIGARFHADYNRSGGEDVDFFAQLLAGGARMVACADAIAHEEIQRDRMTFRWILARRYRTGHTLGLLARHRGGRLARAVKAIGRIGVGTLTAAVGAVTSQSRLVRGVTDVVWGAGTLAALFGRREQSSVNQY